MADKTKIEWSDATWNPITGCSVVGPGCKHCYAMKLAGTRLRNHPSRAGLTQDTKAGPVWTGEVRFNPQWLDQPLRWRQPRMIFVCAHSDLFHPDVPDEWIDRIFAVIALSPEHSFQILTKRPERMRAYIRDDATYGRILREADSFRVKEPALCGIPISNPQHAGFWPHVWFGVSVEDQANADERIPILLDTPAAVRWISAEPLLGRIDLDSTLGDTLWIGGQRGCGGRHHGDGSPGCPRHLHHHHDERCKKGLDWVVVGGESGDGARPMDPDWARTLRDQCAVAGVAFLFKQWGNWRRWDDVASGFQNCSRFDRLGNVTAARARLHPPYRNGFVQPEGDFPWRGNFLRFDKAVAGRLLDGVEHNGYPPLPPSFVESRR